MRSRYTAHSLHLPPAIWRLEPRGPRGGIANKSHAYIHSGSSSVERHGKRYSLQCRCRSGPQTPAARAAPTTTLYCRSLLHVVPKGQQPLRSRRQHSSRLPALLCHIMLIGYTRGSTPLLAATAAVWRPRLAAYFTCALPLSPCLLHTISPASVCDSQSSCVEGPPSGGGDKAPLGYQRWPADTVCVPSLSQREYSRPSDGRQQGNNARCTCVATDSDGSVGCGGRAGRAGGGVGGVGAREATLSRFCMPWFMKQIKFDNIVS